MKTKKLFLWTFAVVFPTAWLLSVLRFDSQTFKVLFKILFFPFGYIYLLIEDYYVRNGNHAIMNNEILEFSLWVIFISLQVFLYYYIFRIVSNKLKRNPESK
ncbi:MAG: hypothetical protein RBR35_16160 [Salinivirgaceae bacterium]|nr:hypothetical protein [Salinivirgaceae bacterium]